MPITREKLVVFPFTTHALKQFSYFHIFIANTNFNWERKAAFRG